MRLWTRSNKAVWDEGFEDYESGKAITQNPYVKPSDASPNPDHSFWLDGWLAAAVTAIPWRQWQGVGNLFREQTRILNEQDQD